jgi:hypothetical protein
VSLENTDSAYFEAPAKKLRQKSPKFHGQELERQKQGRHVKTRLSFMYTTFTGLDQ